MSINTIDTSLCKITIIDNFYEDFNGVLTQIRKLPVAFTEYNDEHMFDGRKNYCGTMRGTYLDYYNEYPNYIKDIIGYGGNAAVVNELAINVNKPLDNKYEDYIFNPHTDELYPNSVATLVFLNEYYSDGEGFNTYKFNNDYVPGQIWYPKNALDINHFFQAKPNRAILFSTDLLHGAVFETEQFLSEYRETQIIFTKLS